MLNIRPQIVSVCPQYVSFTIVKAQAYHRLYRFVVDGLPRSRLAYDLEDVDAPVMAGYDAASGASAH